MRVVLGNSADPFGGMGGMDGGGKRYGLERYPQADNALNFSGVVGSPFFGQPTSAAPLRPVEVGARLNF